MEFPPIDVLPIIDELCSKVPKRARALIRKDPRKPTTGWTTALKSVLDEMGTIRGYRSLYTKRSSSMREFLLDFVWWDDDTGVGILGCESEFGNKRYKAGNPLLVGEDFDKLLSFKARIKLMVFDSYTGKGKESELRREILAELDRYISSYGYHLKGEIYVAIDMSDRPKAWTCLITSEGTDSSLSFQPLE